MDGTKKISLVSLIINAVLVVAVVVLYYFQFSGSDAEVGQKEPTAMTNPIVTSGSSATIAFVNSDMLLQKYALVEKLGRQLEKETRKKDADFSARQKEFESEAAYFQESMANQSLNEQSAQRIYDQLMAKQQELYQLQQQYTAELSQKEFEMNATLLDSVKNYLDRMNGTSQYDYILNYNASGSILQANNSFDITEQVLEGLNKEYNEKYAPPAK